MLVIANIALDGGYPHAGNVHIPAIYVISLGQGGQDSAIDGIAVDNLELLESYALLKPGRRAHARYYHELDQFLGLDGELASLRLFQPVL